MKVSVIMPTFNHGRFIERALKSILAQDLAKSEYEVIVIDDCSTDNTREILQKFSKSIKVFRNKTNKGLVFSCNRGIRHSSGKYIFRFDSDDEVSKNILSKEVKILDKDNRIGFVYTDRWEILLGSKPLIRFQGREFSLFRMIACGIMFRKKNMLKVGLYDKLYFEEYDFMIRYASKYKSFHITEPLYKYYLHGSNISCRKKEARRGWKQLIHKWGRQKLEKWGYDETLYRNC